MVFFTTYAFFGALTLTYFRLSYNLPFDTDYFYCDVNHIPKDKLFIMLSGLVFPFLLVIYSQYSISKEILQDLSTRQFLE